MADLIETKEVNGKFYKTLKLSNMSLGQNIELVKKSDFNREYNSKYGKSYLVYFDINGEDISCFLSEKQFDKWQNFNVGEKIRISKEAKEIDTPKGKIVIGVYNFEKADGSKPSSPTPSIKLTDKQKMILKFMVDNNMKPTDRITVENKVVTFEEYLGKNVVNNPQEYL